MITCTKFVRHITRSGRISWPCSRNSSADLKHVCINPKMVSYNFKINTRACSFAFLTVFTTQKWSRVNSLPHTLAMDCYSTSQGTHRGLYSAFAQFEFQELYGRIIQNSSSSSHFWSLYWISQRLRNIITCLKDNATRHANYLQVAMHEYFQLE